MNENNQLIVILGPTAIGKTKTSVEVAKHFGGEIINSDAFALYKTADIMTAKANAEERAQAPHHMLDLLELDDIEFNVNKYVDCFKEIVDSLDLAVLVGGTNYYVDSVLFEKKEIELKEVNAREEISKAVEKMVPAFKFLVEKLFLNSEADFDQNWSFFETLVKDELDLHCLLKVIDPEYASFLHVKDKRKVLNCLKHFFKTGRQKSEEIKEEQLKLRYPSAVYLVIEIDDFSILEKRIRSRIEEMVEEGILEIYSILTHFIEKGAVDYTRGIQQAIGYKEFDSLVKIMHRAAKEQVNKILEGDKPAENLKTYVKSNFKEEYEKCLNILTNNTVNYAKSQVKWINKRIVPYLPKERVVKQKIENFDKLAYYAKIDQSKANLKEAIAKPAVCPGYFRRNNFVNWKSEFCEVCELMIVGEIAISDHLKSKKHRKNIAYKNK